MATEKYPGEDLNFQGLFKVKEAADVQISTLNEESEYLGAVDKSVLSHLRQITTKLKALDAGNLYQGNLACAGNPNYPAASKDQYWRVSTAGKVGGVSGTFVEVGDMIYCLEDTIAGTEAAVGSKFQIQQGNINRPYLIRAEDAYTTNTDDNAGGLASAITLANECKTVLSDHYADAGGGALLSAILLANELKTVFNLHVADAGGGGEEHTAVLASGTITAPDATNYSSLLVLILDLLGVYDAHDTDAEQIAPVVHIATEAANHSLASTDPPADLFECITRVNDLKAKIDAHIADSTAHTAGDGDTTIMPNAAHVEEHINAQSAISVADATDLTSLLALVTSMLNSYDAHDDDAEKASGWAIHVGQEAGNHSLASTASPTTLATAITRLNDLKAKVNAHVADSTCHTDGDSATAAEADAANTAVIQINVPGVLSGDQVHWSILNGGSGSRTGVSAVAGTGKVTFTFSGDPGADAIISYAVFRPAVS